MSAACAIEGHAAEDEIGEIKAAGGVALCTGEWYPAEVDMLIIGCEPVNQHVGNLLAPLGSAGESNDGACHPSCPLALFNG